MLYLGIDQHARRITISLRDDHGGVVQARQVSTEPKKMDAFFQQLTRLRKEEPFVAVLACRVGRVERFLRAHSLANYWGLTPGCRNSGRTINAWEASPKPAAPWPGGYWPR